MNLLYLSVLGLLIGGVLFLTEPEKQKKLLLFNVVMGIMGAIFGGIYAQLFFGFELSRLGLSSFLVISFGAVLFWFLGRVIRQTKS